ncbi:MAG: protein phosphatase 2C domain-containing protein [Thermoflexales bacterium]
MSSTEDTQTHSMPAAVAITDTGKARQNNEDRYALPPDLVPASMRAARGSLYLVADGMGGHSAGEVASELAARVIPERFYNDAGSPPEGEAAFDVGAALTQAIAEAAEGIRFEQMLTRERAQMGTTVVAAVIRGSQICIANVGDSRAYRMRDGNLEVLSQDHSWVAEQQRAGIITAEQAAEHPQRSALTRALGHPISAKADIAYFDWKPGDRLLLCSDGLWETVQDEQIARAMRQPDMNDGARMLVAAANDAGGPDNITVLVIGDGAADSASTATFAKVVTVAPTVKLPPVAPRAGGEAAMQGIPVMAAAAPAPVEVVTPKPGLLSRLALPVAGLVGVCLCLALVGALAVVASSGGLALGNPPAPTREPTRVGASPVATAVPPTVAVTPASTRPAPPATQVPAATATTGAPLGPSLAPSPTVSAVSVVTPGSIQVLPHISVGTTGTAALSGTVGPTGTLAGSPTITRNLGLANTPSVTVTVPLTPSAGVSPTGPTAEVTGTGTVPSVTVLTFPSISVNGSFGGLLGGAKACAALSDGACANNEVSFARGIRRVYVTWQNPLPVGTAVRVEWLLNGKIRADAGDICVITATGCNPYVTRTSAMLSYVPPIPAGAWTYRIFAADQAVAQGNLTIR